jgi:osmotically-inducible protein OsmY
MSESAQSAAQVAEVSRGGRGTWIAHGFTGMITTGAALRDERLRQAVEAELAEEPGVDARDVGVAAKDGIVTLAGHVSSHAEKIAAERTAARVPGVQAVVAALEVRLPAPAHISDEDIARAVLDAFSRNPAVPSDRIKIYVEDAWVALEGEVNWGYQKAAACSAVAGLTGVRGVRDRLTIRPESIAAAVKAHIQAALEQAGSRDGRDIMVEASGDHVTLRGTVPSRTEWEAAERAAWNTPGVCHVNNNLAVRRSVPARRAPKKAARP